jgi:Siphovirus Gp157
MTSLHLYEITGQLKQIEKLMEADDLPPDVIRDTLEAVEGEFSDKVKAIVQAVRNLDASGDAIAAEAKAMKARADRVYKRAENIRAYLMFQMLTADKLRFEFPEFTVAVRDNPESVVINDDAKIPNQYWRLIPESAEPDKKALKDAIKGGAEIPGVWLQRSQKLEVKV